MIEGLTISAHQENRSSAPQLPADVVLILAAHLSAEELVTANQVCSAWRAALSSSSAVWGEARARSRIDAWDRGLGAREQVLRHVRTEHAWAAGAVRSSSRVLRYDSDPRGELTFDPCTGLALMWPYELEDDEEDHDPSSDGYDREESLAATGMWRLVDTRTWKPVHLLRGNYDRMDLCHGVLFLHPSDACDQVEVLDVVRGRSSLELVPVCTIPTPTRGFTRAVPLGTEQGMQSAVVQHVEPRGIRMWTAPDWEPQEIKEEPDWPRAADLIPLLTPHVLAYTLHSETTIFRRNQEEDVCIKYNCGSSSVLAYRVCADHGVGYLDIPGLVAGDEGFLEVQHCLDDDDDDAAPAHVPLSDRVNNSSAYFNGTDLLIREGLHKVLILRDCRTVFHTVGYDLEPFESGSHDFVLQETNRNSILQASTIAVRFDSQIEYVRAHGTRFAILVDGGVLVLDSRMLPVLPFGDAGPQKPYPALRMLALPGPSIPAPPAVEEDTTPYYGDDDPYIELGLDERAVYIYESEPRTMTVHAFGD